MEERRVEQIKKSIQQSMLRPKKYWHDESSVFEAYPDATSKPLIIRHALAVRMKFSNTPIQVWPGQLIAGSIVLPDSDIHITGALPDHATTTEKAEAAAQGLSVGSIIGHIVPSYPKLLNLGTAGIKRDAKTAIKTANPESKAFFEAIIIVMEALEILADRHAKLCLQLAETEASPARKKELEDMAADLAYAPKNPAKTFTQAVAAIWLGHYAFQLSGNQLAIGRFDQHVWHYLKEDMNCGLINQEKAQDLVTCFFLKFNERSLDNDVQRVGIDVEETQKRNEAAWAMRSPFAHTTQRHNIRDNIDATNHWLQNVIIGGVLPKDGQDATNPVTYMCLEAFDTNRMTNPCLTLRLSSKTPSVLYRRACEVLKDGGGSPAFYNDESIIPSLEKWGIALEDARDYTNDGCWEVIIAGRNDFYFDRFNMLRCLEWALNNGKSLMDGKEEAPNPGDASHFDSYEAVYDVFLQMLHYVVEGLMEKICREFGRRAAIAPVPLLSALLDGCMENGNDMTAIGAKYITFGLLAEGVSHVIDSLAAIKTVVFEEADTSMAELIQAIKADYEGYEPLRQKLLAAPKHGRNQKAGDDIGTILIDDFASMVAELNKKYDTMIFLPGAGTFSWYIAIGEGCGASPDGRKSGEPVSSNMTPSAGVATGGVTGAILSHATLGMQNLPVGAPTDLRLSANHTQGEEGLKRLEGLLRAFVSLGGNMLTLTIADTKALREAQKHPEKYRDLRVRMGGWTAYFTMLSAEQQEHHIAKQDEM